MDRKKIESVFRATLADHRASRSERRAISELLDQQSPNDHEIAFLRNLAFQLAAEQIEDADGKMVLEWLEDIVKLLDSDTNQPAVSNRAYFSPQEDCVSVIRSLFSRARRQVDVCVFTITDNDISDAITDAHRRGIKVRIISDNDKSEDRGSDIDRFERYGIPVRVDRTEYHMHHKFAVFDRDTVLTGSYNWTRGAATKNEENITVSDDAGLASEFSREFERLWQSLR